MQSNTGVTHSGRSPSFDCGRFVTPFIGDECYYADGAFGGFLFVFG
jgi:hypothetical protein